MPTIWAVPMPPLAICRCPSAFTVGMPRKKRFRAQATSESSDDDGFNWIALLLGIIAVSFFLYQKRGYGDLVITARKKNAGLQ